MQGTDKKAFAEIFSGACFNAGRDITQEGLRMYFNALQEFDIAKITAAFTAHARTSNRMPAISDVLSLLGAGDSGGHPGAEEAWGIVSQILGNESETVFMTDPMREAWAACAAVFEHRDEVGARLCFHEVYRRQLTAARMSGARAVWRICSGSDPDRKRLAIERAVEAGRIQKGYAMALLPSPAQAQQKNLLTHESATETQKSGIDGLVAMRDRLRRELALSASRRHQTVDRDAESILREIEVRKRIEEAGFEAEPTTLIDTATA